MAETRPHGPQGQQQQTQRQMQAQMRQRQRSEEVPPVEPDPVFERLCEAIAHPDADVRRCLK